MHGVRRESRFQVSRGNSSVQDFALAAKSVRTWRVCRRESGRILFWCCQASVTCTWQFQQRRFGMGRFRNGEDESGAVTGRVGEAGKELHHIWNKKSRAG